MTQHVELLGTYGGDRTHALSAWTSTFRDLTPDSEKRMPTLLKFLADNGHETPFEKSDLHFLVRVDTATHIQILKHRIGVSVNGESARYKELKEPTCHVPEDWPEKWQAELDMHFHRCAHMYRAALRELEPILGRKRAKESARYFLPFANQLTLDVSFNFRSFVHFLRLRAAPDAQKEINDVASQMLDLVRQQGDFEHSLNAFNL